MEILICILVGIPLMFCLPFLAVFIVSKIPWWSRAEQRSVELLHAVLTSEEYYQLSQLGYLDIPSSSNPQLIYRVPADFGRVKVIENERVKASLCLQTLRWVPNADMIVIHKLMIEADEDTYLQKANRFMAGDSGF